MRSKRRRRTKAEQSAAVIAAVAAVARGEQSEQERAYVQPYTRDQLKRMRQFYEESYAMEAQLRTITGTWMSGNKG